ncbi:MAG: hypothetical protein MUC64_06070 [Rubritepida sp.]|nr:hypothetical protein [Rubritepida sp.]
MAQPKLILVAVAAVGLAACAPESVVQRSDAAAQRGLAQTQLVPLLDATGTAVTFVPESEVRNLSQGSPFCVNQGGQVQTLTVGARQEGAVSAGQPRVIGNDTEGCPVIMRATPGRGDLAPEGIPVVVGATDVGRPVIQFMTPAEASAYQRRARPATPRS